MRSIHFTVKFYLKIYNPTIPSGILMNIGDENKKFTLFSWYSFNAYVPLASFADLAQTLRSVVEFRICERKQNKRCQIRRTSLVNTDKLL